MLTCRAERVLADWTHLENRAQAVYDALDKPHQLAFNELVLTQLKLYANLHRMYVAGESTRGIKSQVR